MRIVFAFARVLSAKGDYAKACPEFEASIQIYEQLGTRLNLANCYEALGRTASAWAEWRRAAATARRIGDNRDKFATDRATSLEPKLAKLEVDVTAVAGIQVVSDGQPVPAAMFGKAVPVDPGPHTVTATAPGHPAFAQTVDVAGEGKVVTVQVVLGEQGHTQPPPQNPPHVSVKPTPSGSGAARSASSSLAPARRR